MKLFRSCFNSLFLKVISLAHDLSNVVCYPRSILASYSLRNRSSMKISDSLKILFSIFPTLRLDQVHCSKIVSSFKYVKISALKLLALYCLNCLVLTILGNTSLDINHTMVADSQMNDSWAEGLQLSAKGSKNRAGGKRLHLLVVISHNNGVVLVEE
jgi:hypothetical protein